ncbi:TonB family protein [Sphingobium chlorophenolicum L-1]|uniref:TonB family protein n=1 Tax=Sphingobium chlorophenolicum L-1 TaxID=690566 RepID=F6EXF7_SPHCR|nr:energy transducer TonB [Sphingobium chlorophenolicum]AEG48204.1 TonB family protein [Sphingobium chlorophenolicum L-1]
MTRAAHPFRIGGPAAASLLVNALLIAGLLNLGMGHVSRRTVSPAMTVLSLALSKSVEQGRQEAETAAPSMPAAVPPPPADPLPAPQPTAVTASAPPVVAVPSRLSLPMSAQPAAASVADPAPAASQATRPAMATAASSAAASPARRGAVDRLDLKAPAGTSRSYAAKVRSWLYAHKIYPRRARMRREEGQVQVRFVLDRAGMLLEGAVIQGSGNTILDEEAEAMLRRASPYPPAPAELRGERIEFTAPIVFSLPA